MSHTVPDETPGRKSIHAFRKCAFCHKEFKLNRSWQKFCSGACREAMWAGSKRIFFPVEEADMSCDKCIKIQQGADRIRYRWRDTVILIQGCEAHVSQIIVALNEYQEANFGN